MVTTDPIELPTVFPGPHNRTPSTSGYVRTRGLTKVCNEVLMPRHQLESADYPTRRFGANIGDAVIQKPSSSWCHTFRSSRRELILAPLMFEIFSLDVLMP